MNRIIKFRAWNIVTKTMVDLKKVTPFAVDMPGDGLFIPFSEDLLLMQFTGLFDKNGKAIYEGDVLARTTDRNFVFVVDFSDGSFSGVTEPGRVHRLSLSEALNLERSPYVEVIGNIYENPELLKITNHD